MQLFLKTNWHSTCFFLEILLKIYKLIRYMSLYIFKYIIYIRYIFYFSMLLQVIVLSNFPPLHWMTWLSFQSSRIAFSLSSQPPPIVSPGPSSSLPQLILFVRMSTHGLHQSSLSACNARVLGGSDPTDRKRLPGSRTWAQTLGEHRFHFILKVTAVIEFARIQEVGHSLHLSVGGKWKILWAFWFCLEWHHERLCKSC